MKNNDSIFNNLPFVIMGEHNLVIAAFANENDWREYWCDKLLFGDLQAYKRGKEGELILCDPLAEQ